MFGAAARSQIRLSPVHTRSFSLETANELVLPLRGALEAAKVATGLSWPIFLPLATVVVRSAATVPLAVYSRICLRRQRLLQPLLSATVPVVRAQLAQTAATGRSKLTPQQIQVLAAKERRRRRISLYRQFSCQNWKSLLLPAVQIPVFVAMTLAVRSLALYDLSSITEFGNIDAGRFLWLQNMVEPDPIGVLPLTIGACALANVELNASISTNWYKNAPPNSVQKNLTRDKISSPSARAALVNISRAGAILFMTMCFQAPAALQLYWLASNLVSLTQNVLLNIFLPAERTIDYPHFFKEIFDVKENRS